VPRTPLPPKALIRRVGWVVGDERHADVYAERGREQWRFIRALLPAGFELDGRRALDFGCGAGRILRHAAAEDPGCEYWGCDIDPASIAWLEQHASPPLHVLRNGDWPPLPIADAHFDLIWAFSVFTHLTDAWSAWLVELHRLLKPDGILVATVFGPGHSSFAGEPVGEELIGMNVLYPGARWDTGGPLVLHSRWWLEEHWGRAFEIVTFQAGDEQGTAPLYGQSAVVLRKRGRSPSVAELERTELGDAREWAALRQQAASLRREAVRRMDELHTYASSRSWRLTAPLRALAELARRR
jgi:SAM-dependent methyltransferase